MVVTKVKFMLYTADLGKIINLFTHCYADDTHFYGFCRFDDKLLLKIRLLDCIKAIAR